MKVLKWAAMLLGGLVALGVVVFVCCSNRRIIKTIKLCFVQRVSVAIRSSTITTSWLRPPRQLS